MLILPNRLTLTGNVTTCPGVNIRYVQWFYSFINKAWVVVMWSFLFFVKLVFLARVGYKKISLDKLSRMTLNIILWGYMKCLIFFFFFFFWRLGSSAHVGNKKISLDKLNPMTLIIILTTYRITHVLRDTFFFFFFLCILILCSHLVTLLSLTHWQRIPPPMII